jgi:hypothetical protein
MHNPDYTYLLTIPKKSLAQLMILHKLYRNL